MTRATRSIKAERFPDGIRLPSPKRIRVYIL